MVSGKKHQRSKIETNQSDLMGGHDSMPIKVVLHVISHILTISFQKEYQFNAACI